MFKGWVNFKWLKVGQFHVRVDTNSYDKADHITRLANIASGGTTLSSFSYLSRGSDTMQKAVKGASR
jgi:hypothetical protein